MQRFGLGSPANQTVCGGASGVRRLIETIVLMQKQGSSHIVPGVLDPTIPIDIGEQSQRQRIIDAMIESCAEKTYAATTIADIVKRASISRTTFYKRFPNK